MDKSSNPLSEEAVRGNGEKIGAGPESFPDPKVFENAGSPGNYFGDKTQRVGPSAGGNLTMGLSCQSPFSSPNLIKDLGMGRDVSTGKPDGPEMGPVPNKGASAKLEWG